MHFLRYGSAYQLRIETPADLEAVLVLDEALWAATSAPLGAFRCDRRFLELLDRDGTGRIASDELREAVRWLLDRVGDRRCLFAPFETLSVTELVHAGPNTQQLAAAAEYVLAECRTADESDPPVLSLDRIRLCIEQFNQRPFNGDGVMVPESASDPLVAALIADTVACLGGTPDASGKQGATLAQTTEFRVAVKAFLEWDALGMGALDEGRTNVAAMPFGRETPTLYAALSALAPRIERYFELCRILRYDAALLPHLPKAGADSSPDDTRQRLEREPLAKPTAEGVLPLTGDKVNPAYAAQLRALRESALRHCRPDIGDILTETEWREIRNAFKPYADYLASKKGGCSERLPRERLRQYAHDDLAIALKKLADRDMAVAGIRKGIEDLERLWLYAAYLPRLANNFVSFSQLYSVRERALFERGSAVIDGRWFNLAVKVDDLNAHAAIAKTSDIFTIYLEVERQDGNGKFTVALPATHGAKGNLREGKRGIFFDVDRREYDARIVRIIENPISLREALTLPLYRLRDFIVGKIEAISGANEKAMEKNADALFKAGPASAPPPVAPTGGGMGTAGLFVGLGVATAALGSAFAYVSTTVINMSPVNRLLSLLGALAVVFVPVSLVAILKLRSQDLSSLLEACGWAINARLRLSRDQRRQFTRKAPFPETARGTPKRRWLLRLAIAVLALLLIVLAWRYRRDRQPQSLSPTGPSRVLPIVPAVSDPAAP